MRRFALTTCVLFAAATPALAQSHPGSHDGVYPHGPGHIPPDPATHALMHALFHGSWTGTLSSQQGVASRLEMSFTQDSRRNVILATRADAALEVGTASDVMMDGNKLQWTQSLGGESCRATGILSARTPSTPEAIKGSMVCEAGEMTFLLHKKTG
jgi:hypothetical protein